MFLKFLVMKPFDWIVRNIFLFIYGTLYFKYTMKKYTCHSYISYVFLILLNYPGFSTHGYISLNAYKVHSDSSHIFTRTNTAAGSTQRWPTTVPATAHGQANWSPSATNYTTNELWTQAHEARILVRCSQKPVSVYSRLVYFLVENVEIEW